MQNGQFILAQREDLNKHELYNKKAAAGGIWNACGFFV